MQPQGHHPPAAHPHMGHYGYRHPHVHPSHAQPHYPPHMGAHGYGPYHGSAHSPNSEPQYPGGPLALPASHHGQPYYAMPPHGQYPPYAHPHLAPPPQAQLEYQA